MIEGGSHTAATVFMVGVLAVTALLIKSGLGRIGLPSLVGFLALGLIMRSVDARWEILGAGDQQVLRFLGKAGLVTLLFRVGLESNLRGLLKQLRTASLVWLSDVFVAGALGYAAAFYLLHLGTVTSLVVATAFTATSVGISVAVWQEMDALQSRDGELLVDIAELDDVSAVLLMAMLFAVLPEMRNEGQIATVSAFLIAQHAGSFLLKMFGFGMVCFLFSLWVEKPTTEYFRKLESVPDPMLTIAGIGFMIAALAAWLGFSMAIGAFFAGLIFSRDPEAVKMESSFLPIYDLFSPFFFIGIGLQMDLAALTAALGPGAVLAAVAIMGKLTGDGLPVYLMRDRHAALLIGASMVPRAEITMVIMQRGQALGAWAVSSRIYNAMILVCAVTCILAPFTVRCLLKRRPPRPRPEERKA
jgi:Kef-type K+ transport system membrane component KefB